MCMYIHTGSIFIIHRDRKRGAACREGTNTISTRVELLL